MHEPALEIQQLSKRFDESEVVKGISFDIRQGEIFGLLGPNGAGKSTTINMIGGVTRLSSGSIQVFGYDNQVHFAKTRRLVGVMHQEIIVDPFFPIGTSLKLHSGYYGAKDDPEWRNLLIDRLALRPHVNKVMNRLSGGMKRRFMVAKALIHRPKLVILDEPTAGVDVELRMNLWDFVREINQEMGTTVLLTTHHLEEAEEMCSRVAIMNHGEIVALDETRKLLSKIDQKRLCVKVEDTIEKMPDPLQEFAPSLSEQGNVLHFEMSKNMSAGDIIQRIYQSGLRVVEVETSSATLEDVFLKLTGKANANGTSENLL